MKTPTWVALLLLAAMSSASGQSADHYRGTVMDTMRTRIPVPFEFIIMARSDTATAGWVHITREEDLHEIVGVVKRGGDSISLVALRSADTIVFSSPTNGSEIGNRYVRYANGKYIELGTWKATAVSRTSVSALLAGAGVVGVGMVALIFLIATKVQEPWWRAQARKERATITEDQRKKWTSIGGWLALTTVGNGFLALYMIVMLYELPEGFGSSWVIGSVVPPMQQQIFIENATHVFQAFGIVTGLVLIARRSALAPAYWFAMLVALAAYGVSDVMFTNTAVAGMDRLFGPEMAGEMKAEVDKAASQNLRLAMSAVIWAGYWMKSRRVWLVFSPEARTADPSLRSG